MEFSTEKKDGFLIVTASGRMDTTTSDQFEQQCDQWLADGETNVIVDMGAVEYISSAGLRSILVAGKKLKAQSGEVRFCALTDMVSEVFTLSGFGSMFKVYDNVDQAVAG